MTGEKRTETRMRCYDTLCIPYISLHDPPYSYIQCMHAGRGGVIYREYTECHSISFLFLFFFHQSSLYPIKIFAKCFYLLVCIFFSAPTLSELKLTIFRELSVYTNGHGVIIIALDLLHCCITAVLQIQSMWLVDLQRYCNWFTKVDRVSDSCACAL